MTPVPFIQTFFTALFQDTLFDLAQHLILLLYQQTLQNFLLVFQAQIGILLEHMFGDNLVAFPVNLHRPLDILEQLPVLPHVILFALHGVVELELLFLVLALRRFVVEFNGVIILAELFRSMILASVFWGFRLLLLGY